MKAAGGPLDIADAFSTTLYTGNGQGSHTITNGINLSGKGGMVWLKARTLHRGGLIATTARGGNKAIQTNSDAGEWASSNLLKSFTGSGFTVGGESDVNELNEQFVSWAFRKAPRFFDVVSYTGDDNYYGRSIPHDLGGTVGVIFIKRTDVSSNWGVYHRANTAAPETDYMALNLIDKTSDSVEYWNDTAPTDNVFTVGWHAAVNTSGGTYVAYLFAHDTEDDGMIQCGSYIGNGSTNGPVINLGWEPQWLMLKRSDWNTNWVMYDEDRGFGSGSNDRELYPNLQDEEAGTGGSSWVTPNASGFQITTNSPVHNASGGKYIYMAIRKEGA
jgi:hypothetical protein